MTIDMGEFRFRNRYLREVDMNTNVHRYYSRQDSDGLVRYALSSAGVHDSVVNKEIDNFQREASRQIGRCKNDAEALGCGAVALFGLAVLGAMKSGASKSVLAEAPNSVFVAASMGNENAIEILSRSSVSDLWDVCSPKSSRFFIETLLKADPILFISLMKECDSHVANRNNDKMKRSSRLLSEGKAEYDSVRENAGWAEAIRLAHKPSVFSLT